MKPSTKHNLIVALPVLLVRVPILLPLWAAYRLGELAERAYEFLSPHLPGFKR